MKVVAWAAALAALAGCGSGQKMIYVQGVRPLNQNEQGQDTSVNIRVYQLRDDGRFRQASVEELWRNAKDILKEDLLAPDQPITVVPGDAKQDPKEVNLGKLDLNARFVGILALFPKDDDKKARKEVVPTDEADDFVFVLTGYHIEKKAR